ncbi:MAG: chemotaxis protein CheW [Gemmatimonadota bacterium]
MDVLTCRVGPHRLALPVGDVREVLRAAAITPLPGSPRLVDGVVDVRGEPVPVLNGRLRFDVPVRDLSPDEHFILVRAGRRSMLLRVDDVEGLATVPASAVNTLTELIVAERHVTGLVVLPDGMALLHDPETFLSAAESDRLVEAMTAAAHPS